jgi:hypothetical protein
MTTRRRAALVIASAAIVGVAMWSAMPAIHRGTSAIAGAPNGPMREEAAVEPMLAQRETEALGALARAVAAAGRAEDGDPSALSALDEEARARLEDAHRLLETGESRPGAMPGSPMSEAPTAPESASEAAITAADAAHQGRVLDAARAVAPEVALRSSADGPVLLAPGLWAKTTFRPPLQRQAVVDDRSGGGYVISLSAGDFSSLRLDGGLVVPGRFYRVHGRATITGDERCDILVRPLESVPKYYDRALKPPSSNG